MATCGSADVAVDAAFLDPPDDALDQAMRRYRELHSQAGNDLNIGPRLGSLLGSVGLEVVDRQAYFNVMSPFPAGGGPILAARDALQTAGLATPDDIDRWRAATDRLAADSSSALFIPTFTAAGRRPR